MANQTDRRINELAASQHGVVARRQLRQMEVRSDAVRSRIASGSLVELSSRVLHVAGCPRSESATLMAAVLDSGPNAAISHESAAARWALPGFTIAPLHVIAARTRASVDDALATTHRPRSLAPAHLTEIDGIAITTPTRTIFDLASSPGTSPTRLERALDTALARRLVSVASLHRVLDQLAGRGRSGITLMRALVDERPLRQPTVESNLEARFAQIAGAASFRHLERQIDVGDEDGWIGRVDFVDRRRRIVFEIGDALFHGSLTDRRRDEARWDRLRGVGWRVEAVEGFEIFHRRAQLTARLCALSRGEPPNELVA